MARTSAAPDAQPRTREALHGCPTTYEVVADLPTGRVRLGFTARACRGTLLWYARMHRDLLLPHVDLDATWSYSRTTGLVLCPSVAVRLSGRTERDCAMQEGV